MADLWVLVPSRGRPGNVERLVRACALTCTADTRLHFAFDQDDDKTEASIAATGGHRYTVGPRAGLAAWTNDLAARHVKRGDATALGSIGDDMVPVTHGWDRKLLDRLDGLAAGFAYPNDERRDDIPEAVVISTPIVAALGWMALPACHHWFIDNVWADLGRAAGCLAYAPDVLVKHMHPNVPGGDQADRTYYDAAQRFNADLAQYQRWRLLRMQKDAAVVRRVREAALASV